MREEWLNRIAITWANRTRQRLLHTVLDQYSSATEAEHQRTAPNDRGNYHPCNNRDEYHVSR